MHPIGLTDTRPDGLETAQEPSTDQASHEDSSSESETGRLVGADESNHSHPREGFPWSRLLGVVVVLVVYFVLEMIVKSLTVAQFVFVAWRKHPHAGMMRWGAMIADYMNQMWRFCTFASDIAPWPFTPWPRNPE
jgi:hypothetical protein